MQAVGLRTFIWNNAWRSALLLAGFPVLLAVIGYALALLMVAGEGASIEEGLVQAAHLLPSILPLALLVSAVWFVIAFFANQRIIDLASGAHEVTRAEEPRLWNALENLCISRGLAMPRLAIIETPERNAFASGLSRKKGAVTVTRGLLEALNDRELAAVLGHELSHIRYGDARTAVIAAVFAGIITMVGQMVFRSLWWGGGRRSRNRGNAGALILIALAFAVLAYVLSIWLRFALSRTREFSADAGAVELTQDPDAMIAALRKVAGHSDMPQLPAQVQAMLLDSPSESLGARLLATHPPLEARIAALVRYAGGRDLGPLVETPPEPEAHPLPDPHFNPWALPAHPAHGAPAREPKVSPWISPLGR
jgi:heat shock protein HtpX